MEKLLINQGYDKSECKEIMDEMRERIISGEYADDVLADYSLEPDYIMELF
jgi:uncharacterized membrane-anchored protein